MLFGLRPSVNRHDMAQFPQVLDVLIILLTAWGMAWSFYSCSFSDGFHPVVHSGLALRLPLCCGWWRDGLPNLDTGEYCSLVTMGVAPLSMLKRRSGWSINNRGIFWREGHCRRRGG